MSIKRQHSVKPAVLFGEKSVTRVGYIDGYIFACEIMGEDHIVYKKPRRPKYHLVIIVLNGTIRLIVNGERFEFGPGTYINLPTWADIYEIEYGEGFHAMRIPFSLALLIRYSIWLISFWHTRMSSASN